MNYIRLLRNELVRLFIVLTALLPVATGQTQGVEYHIGFFNNSDSVSAGLVQLLVCNTHKQPSQQLLLQFSDTAFNKITNNSVFFNKTYQPNEISLTAPLQFGYLPTIRSLGIELDTDSDVNVYGVSASDASADGFLAPMMSDTSREFYVAGWTGDSGSGLLVANALADTRVNVYRIINGSVYQLKTSFTLTYARMTAQVVADAADDTTGLYVNSTKPISLFVNVQCGQVPINTSYCDFMSEHVPPVAELGTLHIVPAMAGRKSGSVSVGYIVRVVATAPDTSVLYNKTGTFIVRPTVAGVLVTANPITGLQRAAFIEFSVTDTGQPLLINCSQPCVVMVYNKGYLAAKQSDIIHTDPFMMLTVSVNRFVTETCFATANVAMKKTNSSTYDLLDYANYLTVVSKAVDSIQLDGQAIPSSFVRVPIGDYTVVSGPVDVGPHWLRSLSPTVNFGAYVYGHMPNVAGGPLSGYGYPVTYYQQTDDCASSPCKYGSTCIDRVNNYTCQCAAGFGGRNCDTKIDYCASAPCKNGGVCTSQLTTFQCGCPSAFTGVDCSIRVYNPCSPSPCLNNATCIANTDNTTTCNCLPGYTGSNCGNSGCASAPCKNGGTCKPQANNQFTCTCLPAYAGIDCAAKADACTSRPCRNGATCLVSGTSYTCKCDIGFTGTNCEKSTAFLDPSSSWSHRLMPSSCLAVAVVIIASLSSLCCNTNAFII